MTSTRIAIGRYGAKLEAKDALGQNLATYVADFNCPAPPAGTATTTTQTTVTVPVGNADFDAEVECANTEKYKSIGGSDDILTFCSRKFSEDVYEFLMLVPTGREWGALGFNTAKAMAGLQLMWLGVEDGTPSLKYKTAEGYFAPADSLDQPENTDVEIANTAKGLQARWKRPVKQGSLFDLTEGTATYTIIYAGKAGAVGGFGQHDEKKYVGAGTDLAEAGASVSVKSYSATNGNLAHGALMILAWACMTPIGTFFMKYGKHLPVRSSFCCLFFQAFFVLTNDSQSARFKKASVTTTFAWVWSYL